jgi:NAD dependent epimerase/dehydratase
MDLSKGKILVTGAGGFIGSHLVEALLRKGCCVRAFVHYNSANSFGKLEDLGPLLDGVDIFTGNLRDAATVRRAVSGCRIVLHLGALIGIPYSYLSPGDTFATNVGGTQNVLDAARDEGVEKVVITSTSEVYGTPLYIPIDEKHPLQAQSPYAASKIAADKLAESYYMAFDLPVATIRPFNTFGPRQSARAIIPTIITQVLAGDVIHLGSLHTSRDFIFVEDTVSGFLAVAEHDNTVGRVINVGSGGAVSVGHLTELVMGIIGKRLEIRVDEERIRPEKSEVKQLVCNYTLAEELLGWEPGFSLEEGMNKTIYWIRERIHLFKADRYNV